MRNVIPLRPDQDPTTGGAVRAVDGPVVRGASHRITVDGGLECPSAAIDRRLLRGTTELGHPQVNATLLEVREAVDGGDAVEVLVVGTLQRDHALTVTVVVARPEPSGLDDAAAEAFSTVVSANSASAFEVTRCGETGERATASGTIRNEVLRSHR